MSQSKIRILKSSDQDKDEQREQAVQELQRLLACYQLATMDDKRVVWAVLNKYAKFITI